MYKNQENNKKKHRSVSQLPYLTERLHIYLPNREASKIKSMKKKNKNT